MAQTVRYIVEINSNQAQASLKTVEGNAMSAEKAIASLNNTLSSIGVGLGLKAMIDFGKGAVQGAADYETAIKRIKFASENLIEGARNIAFINSEVDKFKIPLQSATDAYGKFLAMLSGSGIQSQQVRKLHDELLLIGKVKGLDEGQLDAAVMNLGKMLESGSLDARHFRPLEMQLSGIGAYVARELGITVHELAILRNKGKMTTIDPMVLLKAIQKQADDLKQFLPESTNTIQSQINELDTAWLRFKNDLVFDNISELRYLFETLKSGVSFLKENEDTIIQVGKALVFVGKAWIAYKASMFATAAINRLLLSNATAQITAFASETATIGGLNAEMRLLNLNLETLIALQAQATIGANALSSAQAVNQAMYAGLNAKNLPINIPAASTAGLMTGAASLISGAVVSVFVAGIAADVANNYLLPKNKLTGEQLGLADWPAAFMQGMFLGNTDVAPGDVGITKARRLADEASANKALQDALKDFYNSTVKPGGIDWMQGGKITQPSIPSLRAETDDLFKVMQFIQSEIRRNGGTYDILSAIAPTNDEGKRDISNATIRQLLKNKGIEPYFDLYRPEQDKSGGAKSGDFEKIKPPNDKVRGAHVINYNIDIREINGQKIGTQQVTGEQGDTEVVALKLRDIIISIVNDSQIRAAN